MQKYDIAIIGGGAAGLNCAMELAHSKLSVCLIEKETKDSNDRTWCYWEKGPGKFDHILFNSWEKINFYAKSEMERLDLQGYQYKMIRSADFYKYAHSIISQAPNIDCVKAEVRGVTESPEEVIIQTNGEKVRTAKLLNSVILDKPDLAKYNYLVQHFGGWFIETEKDAFDEDTCTFMDFRIEQENDTRFFYVLPYDKRRALVEIAVFSNDVMDMKAYDATIQDYLDKFIQPGKFTIEEKEIGQIPMTDYPFHKESTARHIKIGTAGGWVKSSSGYAFKRIVDRAELLVEGLLQDKIVDTSSSGFHRWMDSVMLKVIAQNYSGGKEIFLYTSLPMFQRQGAPAMKKDLTNIRKLCEALGNPQDSFKSIHVAGTNGKGSTCHILSALLQSQGFTVGLYSSPHYKDFRERVKVNNTLMPKKYVIDFVNENRKLIEEIKPSFFEITVALAFQYFSEKQPDYVIVEVGLGGRLDSTNIINPELSIITNISLDHTQFLGNTIPLIAAEKAGIIKKEVPVLIGERQNETAPVFREIANRLNAELSYSEKECEVKVDGRQVVLASAKRLLQLNLEWFMDYQVHNLRTAWVAMKKLIKGELDWVSAEKFLVEMPSKTYFLGRWMRLCREPLIIAESAHNKAGLEIVMEKLSTMEYDNLLMVLGFSSDKDLNSIVHLLPKKARYFWAKANIPRGMNVDYLSTYGRVHDLHGKAYTTVRRALAAARKMAKKGDLIYVGGSIFVVAEVV